ncbi:MAG: hypothetical protein Q7R68_01910 [Nitrospirales bacterium]|nr:hypothetical protein [Nitrospirales bacterium]
MKELERLRLEMQSLEQQQRGVPLMDVPQSVFDKNRQLQKDFNSFVDREVLGVGKQPATPSVPFSQTPPRALTPMSQPTLTIPKTPDTSSFTPAQQKAYDYAVSLIPKPTTPGVQPSLPSVSPPRPPMPQSTPPAPGSKKLSADEPSASMSKSEISSPVGPAEAGVGKAQASTQGVAATRTPASPEEIAQRAKIERLQNILETAAWEGLPQLDVAARPFDVKVPGVAGLELMLSGADDRTKAVKELRKARTALESGDMEGSRRAFKEAQSLVSSATQKTVEAIERNNTKETNISKLERLDPRYGNYVGRDATGGDYYGAAKPTSQFDTGGKVHDATLDKYGLKFTDFDSPEKLKADAQFLKTTVTTKPVDWKEGVFQAGTAVLFTANVAADVLVGGSSAGLFGAIHQAKVLGSKAREKLSGWMGGGGPQTEVRQSDMAGTTPMAILGRDQRETLR